MTKKARTYRIPEDTLDRLSALSKARNKNNTDTLIDLIENAETHTPRYAPREDACTFQYYLGESEAPPKKEKGWYCTKKAPKIELLGSGTIEAADIICQGCTSRINLEERWKQIITKPLEEHTYCKDGGEYDNKTGRIYCPHQRIWQEQNRCFTLAKGGRRCPSLKTLPARPIKKTGITRRRKR